MATLAAMSSIKDSWAAHSRAPVSPEAAVAAVSAAAAQEASDARVAHRHRDILAYLNALWHIGGPRDAHRPKNEDELHRVKAPVLAAAYAIAAGEEPLERSQRARCAVRGAGSRLAGILAPQKRSRAER